MNDTQICRTLRRMLAAEERPDSITSIDLFQTFRLLLQHADERDVYASQGTIARELACSEDTVARSQERLHAAGWIVRRTGGHKGQTNRIAVQLDKLSLGDDHIKTIISPRARELGILYARDVMKAKKVKSLPKGRLAQFQCSIQQMIDKSKGDDNLVIDIIIFAFESKAFRNKAIRGAGMLVNSWARLRKAYESAQPAPAQPHVAPADALPAPL